MDNGVERAGHSLKQKEESHSLLVLDDVRDCDDAVKCCIGDERVIITTEVPPTNPSEGDLMVGRMHPVEAKSFFLANAGDALSATDMTVMDHEWLSELCGKDGPLVHPLEIEIASSYVRLSHASLPYLAYELLGTVSSDHDRKCIINRLVQMMEKTLSDGVRLVLLCCALPNCGPMPASVLVNLLTSCKESRLLGFTNGSGKTLTTQQVNGYLDHALDTNLFKQYDHKVVIKDDSCGMDSSTFCQVLPMHPLVQSFLFQRISPSFLVGIAYGYSRALSGYLKDPTDSTMLTVRASLTARGLKLCEVLLKAPLYLLHEADMKEVRMLLGCLKQEPWTERFNSDVITNLEGN